MTLRFNPLLRNARADAITAFATGGAAILRIYDGTQPATGGAITTQRLLASLAMSAVFAAAAAAGVLTVNPIQTQSSAALTGAASWFRVVRADGSTHMFDGTCSTVAAGTGDLRLDDTNIVQNGSVAVSQGVLTEGNA